MCRICNSAGLVILATLLATTPQSALGQGAEVLLDINRGTVIHVEELSEFLAKSLSVRFTDMRTCWPPAGWVDVAGDCDDTAKWVNPGADEIPGNAADEDCDGIASGAGPGVIRPQPERAGRSRADAEGSRSAIAPR